MKVWLFFDSGSQSSAQSGPDREQVQKEQVQKEQAQKEQAQKEDVQKEQVLKRKGKAVVKERQCGSGKGKRKRFRRSTSDNEQGDRVRKPNGKKSRTESVGSEKNRLAGGWSGR